MHVETPYVFEGPNGQITLADLFADRSQLLVQHFMLGPGWTEGCKSCSYMADDADGMTPHLAQRGVTFVAVSRAPYVEIERFHRRMGWSFNWVSSNANSFNHDFRVSFTPEEIATGRIDYNFGGSPHRNDELPRVSAFVKDEAGEVFHTYSTYRRGVEVMMGTYRMLDLTSKGRAEEGLPNTMQWVRHHDRYEQRPHQANPPPAAADSNKGLPCESPHVVLPETASPGVVEQRGLPLHAFSPSLRRPLLSSWRCGPASATHPQRRCASAAAVRFH